MRRAVVLAICTVVFPISAAAQSPAPPRSAHADARRMVTDDCALARKAGKTCVLEVPPEDVGGKTPTISDINVRVLPLHPSTSLIRLRRDFIVEIVKAGEDL
jgi:hypothetical protein